MNVEEDMIDISGQPHEIQTSAIQPKIVLRIFYIN